MVSPGSKRPILGIWATLLLSEGLFPWMQTIIKPATITEILLEVVHSYHSNFSREAVVHLPHYFIFGLFNQFF